jgi:hypothetical protein
MQCKIIIICKLEALPLAMPLTKEISAPINPIHGQHFSNPKKQLEKVSASTSSFVGGIMEKAPLLFE